MSRRTDVEWLAFQKGLKPAMRVAVDSGHVANVQSRLRGEGAAIVHAPGLTFGGRTRDVLYVGRTLEAAQHLADTEALALRGDSDAHRRLGIALGFPACCVEAYCRRLARGVDVLRDGTSGHAEDYVATRDAWVEHANPLLNCLLFNAGYRFVSFYPCRFDCDVAGRLARSIAEALRDANRVECAAVVQMLASPVAIRSDGARARVSRDAGVIVKATSTIDDVRDEAFAATLVGRHVSDLGAVDASEHEGGPWLVPFGE